MALTREQRLARLDSLEEWERSLWKVSYGALVLSLAAALFGSMLHAAFGLLAYCVLQLAKKLVLIRVRLHIRRLGLTK